MIRNFKELEDEVVYILLETVYSHNDVRKIAHFKLIKNNFPQNIPHWSWYLPVVYGYRSFGMRLDPQFFHKLHIRNFKIVDSDIQSKSVTAHSAAHETKYLVVSILPHGQKFWIFCLWSDIVGFSGHVTSTICTRRHALALRIKVRI